MTAPTHPADDLRRWPGDPALLIDTTRCPACFAALHRPACDVCGLRLDGADAADLLAAGMRVHDAEVGRQAVITRMRAAQDALAAASGPGPTASARDAIDPPPPTGADGGVTPTAGPIAREPRGGPLPGPAVAASTAGAPPATGADVPIAPTAPAVAPPGRRRSGVQVFLLVLGVVLLSVAAIVFLVVAYVVASFEVRSIVVAVTSVLVLGLSALLRVRNLPSTAEGVSAVGVVLLLLDAGIVRANDVFGAAAVDGAAYWAAALLATATVLALGGVVGGLRVPAVAGAVLAPIGVFVAAVAIVPGDDPWTAAWLGGLAVLLLGAGSRFVAAAPERLVLRCIGFAGGTIASVAAVRALPDLGAGSLWSFLAVAAAWTTMLVAMPAPSPWRTLASISAGLSLPLGLALQVSADLPASTAVWAAPVITGGVAVMAAAFARRDSLRSDVTPAFFGAMAVWLGALLPAVVVAVDAALDVQSVLLRVWELDAALPRTTSFGDDVAAAAVAGIASGALAASAMVFARRRAAVLGWLVAGAWTGAALAGAVLAPTLLGTALVLLATAAAALALAATPSLRDARGVTATLASGGMLAAALAWGVAPVSTALWWWIVPGVLGLAVAGRLLARRVWPDRLAVAVGAAHLAVAAVVGSVAAWMLPGWLVASGRSPAPPWADAAFVAALVSALALGALASVPRMSRIDRGVLGLAALIGGVIAASAVAATGSVTFGWIPASVLAVAAIAWLRQEPEPMRLAAAGATPIALGLAAVSLAGEVGPVTVALGLAVATLLASALGHVVLPHGRPPRGWWSAATAVVLGATLLVMSPGSLDPEGGWLVLLVLSPVPLVTASLWGDPIAGDSSARYASWGTPALVVGSAWAWIAERPVNAVEWVTLPLATALLVSGAVVAWRRPAEPGTLTGRTAVLAAAAAVGVLPSVAMSGSSDLRTLVLVAVGAVLVLAGSFAPDLVRGVPVRAVAVATGWVAATGAALVRGSAIGVGAPAELGVEFWPVVALAIGATASVLWVRDRVEPERAAEAALAASIAAASIPTGVAIIEGSEALVRTVVLLCLLGLAHVTAIASRMRPVAGPWLRWTSIALAATIGAGALLRPHVEPFDVVTVPIAAALICAGAVTLRRSPSAGSWGTLGVGLAVLLVPALLADWVDPTLWRLVALGLAAVAAVLVGARLRLQAPFVIGGSVLLVHAVAQLWPWISLLYRAVWWWLWLGIAGAALVVIAATYERQLRLARGAIHSVASLR
ncbi:SCO7613 C-terminal domain-containing membrane protein [Agromyces sp. SYSU T0242]|uniref:SCO7613 C-terminal domain-containing membrane protein n=1 Tax=Agromyces litoreus TaxID=3158561 RepID=UPI003399D877